MSDIIVPADKLLDLHISTWDQAFPYERAPRVWISSSIGYCPRWQVLQRGGVPRPVPFDEKTLRTFAWGRFLHSKVRQVFADAGLLVAEEIELSDPDLHLVGHMDAIVGGNPVENANPSDDPRVAEFQALLQSQLKPLYGDPPYPLVAQEYKSVSSRGMVKLYNQGSPYQHQMCQLAAYKLMADLHPEQLPTPVPERWQLVNFGKDSWGVLVFDLEPEWVDIVGHTLDELNAAWDAEVLPECKCVELGMWDPTNKKRQWCAYPDDKGGCCPDSFVSLVDWSL